MDSREMKESERQELHRTSRLTTEQLQRLAMADMDLDNMTTTPYSHIGGNRYPSAGHEYSTPRYGGHGTTFRSEDTFRSEATLRPDDFHEALAEVPLSATASSSSLALPRFPNFSTSPATGGVPFSTMSLPSPSRPNMTTPLTSPLESDMSWDGDMDLMGIQGGDPMVPEEDFDSSAFFPDFFGNNHNTTHGQAPSMDNLQARYATIGSAYARPGPSHTMAGSVAGVAGASISMPDLTTTGQPRVFECEVCHKVFTTSRRDYERHMAGVHGPPVTLKCGASCKNRKDNIKRHEKKCSICSRIDKASNRLASREQEPRQ